MNCGGGRCVHKGRSPRMRGRPPRCWTAARAPGSIPAYAGEAPGQQYPHPSEKVDPRVCGGGDAGYNTSMVYAGRSPRMRGRRISPSPRNLFVRSIPAYAGEAHFYASFSATCRVDPRVCGGGHQVSILFMVCAGRSPRMRGRHRHSNSCRSKCGSIPAYAGEAPTYQPPQITSQVDPRVCGGGIDDLEQGMRERGRSPRMRGRQIQRHHGLKSLRSIPAYAGEAGLRGGSACPRTVDPRVCGGGTKWIYIKHTR